MRDGGYDSGKRMMMILSMKDRKGMKYYVDSSGRAMMIMSIQNRKRMKDGGEDSGRTMMMIVGVMHEVKNEGRI